MSRGRREPLGFRGAFFFPLRAGALTSTGGEVPLTTPVMESCPFISDGWTTWGPCRQAATQPQRNLPGRTLPDLDPVPGPCQTNRLHPQPPLGTCVARVAPLGSHIYTPLAPRCGTTARNESTPTGSSHPRQPHLSVCIPKVLLRATLALRW